MSNKRGERYILSIIDCFTKYLILVSLKDHTASTVSKALYEEWLGILDAQERYCRTGGQNSLVAYGLI